MFNFIRDAVAVFKIRGLLGAKANWISQVEFPNAPIGSKLPVIIATFPSGDVRVIHAQRNDRIDVMGRLVNADISAVAADLEILTMNGNRIEGFQLHPDYTTKVTRGESPSICEYLSLKKKISEYNTLGTTKIQYVSRLKNLEEGQIIPGVEYEHPSGATTTLAVTPFADIEVFQTLDIFSNLRKVEGFGANAKMVKIAIKETRKGRVVAFETTNF